MTDGFAISPKPMQEVCIEVSVNKESSRLPVIVIQTPTEVEAGLFRCWSNCDEANRSQESSEAPVENSNDFSFVAQAQRYNISKLPESTAEGNLETFDRCTFEPSTNLTSFQFMTKTGNNVEFKNEWRTQMPARKGRSTRSKVKKCAANEQKNLVEEAMFAFKKMRLNCEDMEEDDVMD